MNDGLTSSKVTGSPFDVLVQSVFNIRCNSKLRKRNHRDKFKGTTAEMDIATIFHEVLIPELEVESKNLTLENRRAYGNINS